MADRLGEVLLRARPCGRLQGDRRPPVPGGVGAARRLLRPPGTARPRLQRRHRAPDPELDLRLAAAAGGPSLAGRWSRACASRPATSATTSPPSATTARSSSTRCWSPRSRSPTSSPACSSWPSRELHDNLLTDFGPDGVHRERSTHYHMIALRSFVGARENCRRYGVELPRGFDERLSLACDFALHMQRPDGTIPALSDSDTGDYASCWNWPRGCSRVASCAAAPPGLRASSRRRLLRPARRRPLPDLRLRAARRRRPRSLRRALDRGLGR